MAGAGTLIVPAGGEGAASGSLESIDQKMSAFSSTDLGDGKLAQDVLVRYGTPVFHRVPYTSTADTNRQNMGTPYVVPAGEILCVFGLAITQQDIVNAVPAPWDVEQTGSVTRALFSQAIAFFFGPWTGIMSPAPLAEIPAGDTLTFYVKQSTAVVKGWNGYLVGALKPVP